MRSDSARHRAHRIAARLGLIVTLLLAVPASSIGMPRFSADYEVGGSILGGYVLADPTNPKTEEPSAVKALEIIAAIFAVAFAIGAILGDDQSPDYDDDKIIAQYVAKNSTVTDVTLSRGGIVTVIPNPIYRFPIGMTTIVYDPAKGAPYETLRDPEKDGEPPRRRRFKYTEAVSALALIDKGPELISRGVQWHEVFDTSHGVNKARLVLFSLAAATSGLALGYMLTYSAHPDRQAKSFRERLLNKIFWEAVDIERRMAVGRPIV